MNVVDSCGWLEYLADGPNAQSLDVPLRDTPSLVVPAVCVYEVFKVVLRERGEGPALEVMGIMQRATVVAIGPELAVTAARLSLQHSLPLADSLVLATAQAYDAVLWTQDAHFQGIDGVRYLPKG